MFVSILTPFWSQVGWNQSWDFLELGETVISSLFKMAYQPFFDLKLI
jgi:hypothetical protein